MGRLVYIVNVSVDGFMEGPDGSIDFGVPDDELFAALTDTIRHAGTYLYGRGMYEAMAVWETDPALAADSPARAEFAAIWQAADKVVYSTTLDGPSTARTRVERRFDPEAVRALKEEAAADLTIGGPAVADQAFRHGLVDECRLFVWPVVLGGGKPGLPRDLRVDLRLVDERRFASGVVELRYAPAG